MDLNFSRMHLVGGVLAGGTIAAIAIAHPFPRLTQFSPSSSKGTAFLAIAQRNAVTISILARGMKPKSNPKRQQETSDSPRRGVPGGGT